MKSSVAQQENQYSYNFQLPQKLAANIIAKGNCRSRLCQCGTPVFMLASRWHTVEGKVHCAEGCTHGQPD